MTYKVPIIFHKLKGYDSHLIFCKLNKFDVNISVMQNGSEKYMTFFLNKNLVFIDSMQFINSRLGKLVKYLSNKDFKYLLEEFDAENLGLLKQKGAYPYEYMNSFERFKEKNCLPENISLVQQKKGKIDDDGKKPNGHISVKNHLTCEKV